jgi:hypothetical protein
MTASTPVGTRRTRLLGHHPSDLPAYPSYLCYNWVIAFAFIPTSIGRLGEEMKPHH